MSILKNNLRPSGQSVQSGTCSKNSNIINWVCATFLAGLILLGGSAKAAIAPYNVLINSGAESNDFSGWNQAATGYMYVVSTNGTIPGSGTNTSFTNFLAHSGKYTFQLFDTDNTAAYIWQDYAARPGSQWSASTWAICYASNFFTTAFAYMSVAFYDTNGVVLDATNDPSYAVDRFGVFGTVILDSNAGRTNGSYIITPPPAVDATGWQYLAVTNFYYEYNAGATNNAPGTNVETGFALLVSTNIVAPPGTALVRYQIEYDNPQTDGGAIYWDDNQLNKLTWSDPDLTNPQPAAVNNYKGDSATFSVKAVTKLPAVLEKLTYQWQKDGTNLPAVPGGSFIGATTNASLILSNCQPSDSGMYSCLLVDTNSWIRSVPVPLKCTALTPRQKNNVLGANAGFENAPFWPVFEKFNGCFFTSAANVYGTSTTPVNIKSGNWVCLVGAHGVRDHGFHHQFAATPGSTWKAGGYAYISSLNPFTDGNTCRLQIWFKNSDGISLTDIPPYTPTFESYKIYGLAYTNSDMQYTNVDASSPDNGSVMYHNFLPNDTWCYLSVSNVTTQDGVSLTNDIPHGTWNQGFFIVPTNVQVAQINFQVYEYCPQASDLARAGGYLGNATDAVYWDDMELIQIVPVTNLVATVKSGNINMSFSAEAALNYSVLYKTNLTDTNAWLVLTNVIAPMEWQTNMNSIGTSTNVIVSDPMTAQRRFYRIQVQ
jgi:hypothetical protein